MGRNSPPLPCPSGFADVGPLFIPTRKARGIKRNGTTAKVEEEDEEESPSSYFVDASAVSCSGGFPNHAAVRAVLLFSPLSLSILLSVSDSLPRSPRRLHGGWPRVSSARVIRRGRFPPCYLLPVGYSAAGVNKRIGETPAGRTGRLNSNRRGISQSPDSSRAENSSEVLDFE